MDKIKKEWEQHSKLFIVSTVVFSTMLSVACIWILHMPSLFAIPGSLLLVLTFSLLSIAMSGQQSKKGGSSGSRQVRVKVKSNLGGHLAQEQVHENAQQIVMSWFGTLALISLVIAAGCFVANWGWACVLLSISATAFWMIDRRIRRQEYQIVQEQRERLAINGK